MDHSDLLSLVEDIGTGNVLDSEMLEAAVLPPMSWMIWMR
jgi:hypothetical protein